MQEDGGKKLLKVDNRVRLLIDTAVANNHRAMFVIVGDHAKDQVVFLHHVLTKASIKARPSVLWCYKKELGFSSHRKKRMKKLDKKIKSGQISVNTDDQFEVFISSTTIRYCYYAETHKILGNTFGMAVLQDFEALTPNLLARSVETVEGGGIIVVLLPTRQLASLKMDVHDRYKTEAHQDVVARFNQRFMKSLSSCGACVLLDDRLNILSQNLTVTPPPPTSLEDRTGGVEVEETTALTQPLVKLCKTTDQGKAVVQCVKAIADKTLRTTVAMTAGRGRGKSAALGLSIAAAVAYQYSNIFVTAPSPENLKTLFEFVFKGFDALGYQEHLDYTIIQSTNPELNRAVVRVNVTREHRQTIQYIHPSDSAKLSQAELVCVDEAAAIPLPLVQKLLGPYLVFLSSTISGYEGTGRSLSLKLIKKIREESVASLALEKKEMKTANNLSAARRLEEVSLEESIRYAGRDPVEAWLSSLLCLDASPARLHAGCPAPAACQLVYVNRDHLFCGSRPAESLLNRVVSLFVASHYKNSPNDLQLLSDAPAHHIFVLVAPVTGRQGGVPDVLCALQVCLEGEVSKASIANSLARGKRAAGDLIPWTVSQQFLDSDFASLSGARVVRIATHPEYQRMGYGRRAMELLEQYYRGEMPSLDETEGEGEEVGEGKLPPLLSKLTRRRAEKLDWMGVSYGLTYDLLKFWKKRGFAPVYLRQTANELTGEHSCVMLKALDEDSEHTQWLPAFWQDFRQRFLALLSYDFSKFEPKLTLAVLDQSPFPIQPSGVEAVRALTAYQLKRLEQYGHNLVDFHTILDLLPAVSRLYFSGALPLRLSALQNAVVSAMGLQHRGVEDVARQLDLQVSQVLALFNKSMLAVVKKLKQLREEEVEAGLPAVEAAPDLRPCKQSLEDDLREAAAAVDLQQFQIQGSEKSWQEALAGKSSLKGIVSVKGIVAQKRKQEGDESKTMPTKKKKKNKGKKFFV